MNLHGLQFIELSAIPRERSGGTIAVAEDAGARRGQGGVLGRKANWRLYLRHWGDADGSSEHFQGARAWNDTEVEAQWAAATTLARQNPTGVRPVIQLLEGEIAKQVRRLAGGIAGAFRVSIGGLSWNQQVLLIAFNGSRRQVVCILILGRSLREWLVGGRVDASLSQLLLEVRIPEILYFIVGPSW